MDEIFKDARFAHIPRDPAFKRIPKNERTVKIDKRFQSMFNDKRFKVKYTIDKRGRPFTNTSTENLKRYYALGSSSDEQRSSSDVSDSEGKSITKNNLKSKTKNKNKLEINNGFTVDDIRTPKKKSSSNLGNDFQDDSNKEVVEQRRYSSSSDDNGEEESENYSERDSNDALNYETGTIDEKIRTRLQDLTVDYARGEGVILSDSSSDEESTDAEGEFDDVSHGWGELDQEADRTDDSTHRLAVCNMDWDRVKALDLMVLLNSFLPKGGVILSVTIYPSEFGLQRIKEEEEKGPLELRAKGDAVLKDSDLDEEEEKKKKKRKKKGEDDEELEEGNQYHREKLRQYQLNRLKYYYAVVAFDSIDTADALYKECDGMEYESSASRLDLRFVPDDTTFNQEPRDKCTELPDMTKYEPQLFITTALQQSNVRLTWDETDPRRIKLNEKINSGNINEMDENDLKVYLATSSSEDESNGEENNKEASASKYRSLLQSIELTEEEKKQKNMEMEVTWGIDLKQKVDKRLKEGKPDELTPFQKYMQKRKEKRKAKREEQIKKKQQYREENGESPEGSEREDEIPSDVDMNDAYFKEEFQKEEFAHTKKDKSKKNKNKKKLGEESEDEETKRKKAELELLLMDQEDGKKHFSLKDILVDESKNKKKKKRKKRQVEEEHTEKNDDFEINLKDNRFSALFTSHLYNIDPADPHFKKTKGMEALRQEKLSRRAVNEEIPLKKQKMDNPSQKKDAELSLLVKNVKRRALTLNK